MSKTNEGVAGVIESRPDQRPDPANPAKGLGDPLGFLSRILRYRAGKGKSGANRRRHKRYPCTCLATMSIVNRSTSLEGVITEISKGGLKFRPAKVYLLERNNTPVLFEFSNFRISGTIVTTRNDGYGIALFDDIADEQLEAFLNEYSTDELSDKA